MKLTKNVKKQIDKMNYCPDRFKADAKRYIKAIKEGRMCCIIESVSRSGMSRDLKFIECAKGKNRYNFYNFNQFFIALGFTKSRSNDFCFRIGGCGMDMVFYTNYTIIHQLYRMRIIQRKTCDRLAQLTPNVL